MAVERVPKECPNCERESGWKLDEREKRGSKIVNALTRPGKSRKVDETWKCLYCGEKRTYRVE
jgi:predicted RNA-binding Zn-ribbon protein involved in translation (DUF1610 family)